MPGISVIMITPGPLPATCTTFATPSKLTVAGIEVLKRIVLVHVPSRHSSQLLSSAWSRQNIEHEPAGAWSWTG